MQDYDVVIVGYGPTGMVAASLLGRQGHAVAVVERWPGLYGLPRFTHIDGEVARLLQGAADVDRALRDSGPTSLTYQNGEGRALFTVPASTGSFSGFPDHISIYQPDVEAALDEQVRACGSVDLLHRRAVVALEQDEDGVTVTVAPWDAATHTLDEPASEALRCRYVIGADGARSTIRTLLGVGQDDFGFNERWMNLDTEWIGEVPEHFHDTVQTCDPARGHMTMRIGERRQRFEFALLEGEDSQELTSQESGWALLRSRYGIGPDDVQVLRRLVYTFEGRVTQAWQVGRVFLAGDAAHTMPPYLGQGACSGIRDAANLAWKLDLVCRGLAGPALLETYEPERRPHATALVHASIGLGRVANTHDEEQAAARDAAFFSGNVPPPPPLPPMSAGVLRVGPGGTPVPPVGTLTPQGLVRAGDSQGRLDDVVGHGFLLVTRAAGPSPEREQHLLDLGGHVVRLGHDVVDLDGAISRYLDSLGADAYLARPDLVLFGTASGTEVGGLVDDLDASLAAPAPSASA